MEEIQFQEIKKLRNTQNLGVFFPRSPERDEGKWKMEGNKESWFLFFFSFLRKRKHKVEKGGILSHRGPMLTIAYF